MEKYSVHQPRSTEAPGLGQSLQLNSTANWGSGLPTGNARAVQETGGELE